ncbi:AP endonuclease [Athelia psychrophila]|uniref:Apurinic-apyrimidinic endonuclease 1 n=1 Tax=Athelia psychrophila TaxID=1759441 RepID=A0A166IEC8_9AGAM|nr:AP endonuclease [Fibularhizoctonia sp. CBS 109695]
MQTRRSTRVSQSVKVTTEAQADIDAPRPAKRLKTAAAVKEIAHSDALATNSAASSSRQEPKRQRKTKAKPEEPKPEDFPARAESLWKVGVHVSAAGGVENAVPNAAKLGANSFALFLKSQRKWTSPALTEHSIKAFKARLESFGYSPAHVLPHGSYLINLGNPDPEKREKSYECFLDDLQRCELLGLELYNFHPGSTVGQATRSESIALISASLNRAHKATQSVVTVLENMAGAGNIIGATFEDLGDIVRGVEDKTRVGVCLDTCHLFAAGYDIRTKEGWQKTMDDFDAQVGLPYLRGMHLNDSKALLASKRDRHENIGMGHLGLAAFHHILTDTRLHGLPLTLETPSFEVEDVWRKEVEVLNRLSALTAPEGQAVGWAQEMAEEVRTAVQYASSGKDAKEKGKRTVKKRGRRDVDDEEEEEEGHECDH